MSIITVIVIAAACFLAAILNLTAGNRLRNRILSVCFAASLTVGLILYGYGYAYVSGTGSVAVLRTLLAVFRMITGDADLESIEFDNITFSYSRGDSIIEDSSLSVKKGDFVAIMGISGIGKSTLLKLLLGVFNTQSGEIYLNTKDGKILADKHTRPLFSYVPQGNFLLSGTIRENITFLCKDVSEDKINEAIRMSCSEEFVKNLDDGLDTVIGERGLGLSEGQVQRLAVARALLSGSPVLLLDESTSALDEATEAQLLENLKNSKDITCIIVTHKKAALDICNRHIQINDKKIVSEG